MIHMVDYNPMIDEPPGPPYYNRYTDDYLRKLRAYWDRKHIENGKGGGETPDEEKLLGLKGELYFARRYGLWFDTKYRPGGDGGADQNLPKPIGTVDVKAGYNGILRHTMSKPMADIFVLLEFNEQGGTPTQSGIFTIVGWAYKEELMAAPQVHCGSNRGFVHWKYQISGKIPHDEASLDRMFNKVRAFASQDIPRHPVTRRPLCPCLEDKEMAEKNRELVGLCGQCIRHPTMLR